MTLWLMLPGLLGWGYSPSRRPQPWRQRAMVADGRERVVEAQHRAAQLRQGSASGRPGQQGPSSRAQRHDLIAEDVLSHARMPDAAGAVLAAPANASACSSRRRRRCQSREGELVRTGECRH
jgi:hypothetical protein